MKRLGRWFIVSLVVATLLLTLTVAFGWSSSNVANDLAIFVCNVAVMR